MTPARFTPPLEAGADGLPVHSDGYRLIALVEKYWKLPDGQPLELDRWQRDLLIRILETKPDGSLRYRQVLVSIPRQNGKSLLGAILQLYGLLQHVRGPSVLGMATNVKQAAVVYDRTYNTVVSNPVLSEKLKATGTRGIRHRDGSGTLYVLPAKEESVQGEPVTLAIVDELHILKPEIWYAITNGQRSKPNALVIGITTAGDDTSVLLHDLYRQADLAISEPETSTLGAFIWEAPAGCELNDVEAIRTANPAIACGRIPIAQVLADTKNLPEFDVRRYLLNQHVSNINVWIDPNLWTRLSGPGITDYSEGVHVGIDTGPSLSYTTVYAARRTEDGVIEAEVVLQVTGFDLEKMRAFTDQLASKHKVLTWNLDPFKLTELAHYLEDRGRTVHRFAQAANQRAAANAYSLISAGKVRHDGNAVLTQQLTNGVAKHYGDGWRVVPARRGVSLDSLHAMFFAVYAAETHRTAPLQLFV